MRIPIHLIKQGWRVILNLILSMNRNMNYRMESVTERDFIIHINILNKNWCVSSYCSICMAAQLWITSSSRIISDWDFSRLDRENCILWHCFLFFEWHDWKILCCTFIVKVPMYVSMTLFSISVCGFRIFFFLFGKSLYCTFIWYAEHCESKISKPSYAFVEPGYFSLLIWLTVTSSRSNTVVVEFNLVALSSGTSPFRKHIFFAKLTLSDYLLIFVAWLLQYL